MVLVGKTGGTSEAVDIGGSFTVTGKPGDEDLILRATTIGGNFDVKTAPRDSMQVGADSPFSVGGRILLEAPAEGGVRTIDDLTSFSP